MSNLLHQDSCRHGVGIVAWQAALGCAAMAGASMLASPCLAQVQRASGLNSRTAVPLSTAVVFSDATLPGEAAAVAAPQALDKAVQVLSSLPEASALAPQAGPPPPIQCVPDLFSSSAFPPASICRP